MVWLCAQLVGYDIIHTRSEEVVYHLHNLVMSKGFIAATSVG